MQYKRLAPTQGSPNLAVAYAKQAEVYISEGAVRVTVDGVNLLHVLQVTDLIVVDARRQPNERS